MYKEKEFWNISYKNYPQKGSNIDKIKFILGYAILAPSTHNIQPWNFKISGNICEVYYDKSLNLPEADPNSRDLYISMGTMLTNLRIAAESFGVFDGIQYVLEDNFIAKINFCFDNEINIENSNLDLLKAISDRVNVRGVFFKRNIDYSAVKNFFENFDEYGINTHLLVDSKKIQQIASLTVDGLTLAHARKSFRKEMSKWMHNNFTRKLNGLPGYSLRMPLLLSFIIPSIIPYFNLGSVLGKLNSKSINSAPAIGVITSDKNDFLSWLRVGEIFELINLKMVDAGLRTSIYVASIETSGKIDILQSIVGTSQLPQFLFCIGYMNRKFKHTPRLPLEDKIIN